jgi:cobalamin synthase
MTYLVAFVIPIIIGVTAHSIARRKLLRRTGRLAEAIGWVTTLALAAIVFPPEWRGLEYFTLAASLWYALVQIFLCVAFQPVARRIVRESGGTNGG